MKTLIFAITLSLFAGCAATLKARSDHDVEHAAEQIPVAVTAILKDFPPR